MKEKTVLFSGTFDLFHKGHLDFLKFLIKQYKHVIICISNNHNKKKSSYQTRFLHLCKVLEENNIHDVIVVINYGLTIDIAKELNCDLLVRSYVNDSDYKYELQLKYANSYLNKKIKTELIFFNENPNIRSSLLKEIDDDN